MQPVRTIGIVNRGSDASGRNAVIRGVVRLEAVAQPTCVKCSRRKFALPFSARSSVGVPPRPSMRFGVAATDLVANGQFGRMVCLKAGKMASVSFDEALGKMKFIDPSSEIARAARCVAITFGDSA